MRQIGRIQPAGSFFKEASSGPRRPQIYSMQRLYLCRGFDLRGANTGQLYGIGIADMQAQLGV